MSWLSPLGEGSDGLCAHGEEAALLVVNTDYPTGRTRFTLAHELGHHLLRDPRDVIEEQLSDMFRTSYIERRVNAFAGHLLLPLKAVATTFVWLGCGRDDLIAVNARGRAALGYLMVRYGVSLPCALSRIVEAGFLTVMAKRDPAGKLRAGELVRAAGSLISERPGPEKTTHEQRPPSRLVTAALEAARAGHVGMNTVAVLLGRADDDAGVRRGDVGRRRNRNAVSTPSSKSVWFLAKTALDRLQPGWTVMDTARHVELEDIRLAQEDVADGRTLTDDLQHWAESTIIALARRSATAGFTSIKMLLSEDYDARRVACTVPYTRGVSIHALFHERVQRKRMTPEAAAELGEILHAAGRGPAGRGPAVTASDSADPTGRGLGRVAKP